MIFSDSLNENLGQHCCDPIIKKYLVEFKYIIPYYGDHKSYPPVQKESCIIGNKMSCNLWVLHRLAFANGSAFQGYWLSQQHRREEGTYSVLVFTSNQHGSLLAFFKYQDICCYHIRCHTSCVPFLILSYHSPHGQGWEETKDRRGKRRRWELQCPKKSESVKAFPLVSTEDAADSSFPPFLRDCTSLPQALSIQLPSRPGLSRPSFLWG